MLGTKYPIFKNSTKKLVVIGNKGNAGTYILRIEFIKDKDIVFGRFKQGKSIHLLSGSYIYIGSALAYQGATTLGNRISRHCDRTSPFSPHQIRTSFRKFSSEIGLNYTKQPSSKTLFWNIDHLTNLTEAEITGIIMIRSVTPLENIWSEYIESRDDTFVFEKGLGANDAEGHTHLQYTTMTNEQWKELPKLLPKF